MIKFDLFDKEDLKQIPLFYTNTFKINKELVNRIELGLINSTHSVRHRSSAYQRYNCVSPISMIKLDEFKNDEL